MSKTVQLSLDHAIDDEVTINGRAATITSIGVHISKADASPAVHAQITYNYKEKQEEKAAEPPKQFPTRLGTFMTAVKSGELKRWWYEFRHGHPFDVKEESDIICHVRLHWAEGALLNDEQIQRVIQFKVKRMYKKKYPTAKAWTFPIYISDEAQNDT